MKITDIKKQVNNKKRYSVFIDGAFAFGLDEVDVLYYKLLENDEISEEKYNYIKENVVFAKARDAALKYISFKRRTKKEIINKLEEKDFSGDIIERVTALFEKYGYIDDYAYAGAYLKDKFNLKGTGVKRIEYELKQRGVNEEIINKVIGENDFDETKKALYLVEKKYGCSLSLDIKEKRRIEGFLLRKGYSFETIQNVFEALKSES